MKKMKMRTYTLALPAIVALALAGPGSKPATAAVDESSKITIPGTVVSSEGEKLVIRTDDHGHRMVFEVRSSTSLPDRLRKGAHVAVTYHPLGPTGQAADEVRVLERGASAAGQASFKVVTGPVEETRVGAR
jgi:hypothetical protein